MAITYICQAIVESTSVKEWQDELPTKTVLDTIVNVMTDFEIKRDLKDLWVNTPANENIIAKGMRQIVQKDDWRKPTLKVTTWEMVKDYEHSIKLTAKYHKQFSKFEVFADDSKKPID